VGKTRRGKGGERGKGIGRQRRGVTTASAPGCASADGSRLGTKKPDRPCPCESHCDDLELLRSEWPGLPSTELQRRLEPLPAPRSAPEPAAAHCAADDGSRPTPLWRLVRDRGMCWYVSRRKHVISSNS